MMRYTGREMPVTLGLTKQQTPPDVAQMDIRTHDGLILDWAGDILAIGVYEESLSRNQHNNSFVNLSLAALDAEMNGILLELANENDFKGSIGQVSIVRLAAWKVKRVALIGLGREQLVVDALFSSDIWRALGSKGAQLAKGMKLTSLGIAAVSTELMDEQSKLAAVEAIASGAILGTYEDTRFKSEARPSMLSHVVIMSLGSGDDKDEALHRAVCTTAGVIVAKQLVATPANVMTPGALADAAVSIAMGYNDVLSVTILDKDQCEALGMGAFLGVANASDQPPKLIHMKYLPPDGIVYKRVAIVGKGICFDSGGYNIKVGEKSNVELMKYDMGGAGAALGAASAIGALKPKGIEVHFISAVCENMISGKGMHPGDIVTASNGKTIEVTNTDAEGRLTMADSLVYASRLHVDAIVDLATLTSACVIALGYDVAGLFTPSDSLAEQLTMAAKIAGEKIWRLPLIDSYSPSLESPIADLVNTSGSDAGSIKAALFLQQFVDKKIEWAHLDIAGPVWNRSLGTASGYPVRTLVKWVDSQQQI